VKFECKNPPPELEKMVGVEAEVVMGLEAELKPPCIARPSENEKSPFNDHSITSFHIKVISIFFQCSKPISNFK
jgi:hypothetical protein